MTAPSLYTTSFQGVGVYATRSCRGLIPQTHEELLDLIYNMRGLETLSDYGFEVDMVNNDYFFKLKGQPVYPNSYDKDRLSELYYFMYAI